MKGKAREVSEDSDCLSVASFAAPVIFLNTREVTLCGTNVIGLPFLLVRFLWANKENERIELQ